MNIVLVGLGVIGGSIGLSLRGKIYGADIKGIDIDKNAIEKSLELNIISDGCILKTEKSKEFLSSADIIILSIYPDAIREFICENIKFFKKSAIIIDTSGVKSHLIDNIELRDKIDLILTHPMAGREKRGIDFASRKVFVGANFLIARTEQNKEENLDIVKMLAKKMGFLNIVETDVKTHDKAIAFTSQLPHAIAVSLINSDSLDIDTKFFIGDSYKEFTRIANINESLWSELFLMNKENLIDVINKFETSLLLIKESLINEDKKCLESIFIESSNRRKEIQ